MKTRFGSRRSYVCSSTVHVIAVGFEGQTRRERQEKA